MPRSNTYVILFSLTLTVILGGLLSLASEGLRPAQKRAEEFATKRQILSAVMNMEKEPQVLSIFESRISSFVIDTNGEVIKDANGNLMKGEDVDLEREFKKPAGERLYPIFKFHEEGNDENVEAYIFAFYGNGLWDKIWGFVALKTDMNTIYGAVFDHKGETPGLGARITENAVRERFNGKEIFDEGGNLLSVSMLKGENNPETALDAHHVNGLSGATITAKGLNKMLLDYFNLYLPYIKEFQTTGKEVASLNKID